MVVSTFSWDLVEELQVKQAHQQQKELEKTAFEEYCEEYPEAKDMKRYDPWLCHWKEEDKER